MQSPEKYSFVSNAVPVRDLFKKTDSLHTASHLHHRVAIALESHAILRPGPGPWEGNGVQTGKDRTMLRFQGLALSDERSQTTQIRKAVTGHVFREQTPQPG